MVTLINYSTQEMMRDITVGRLLGMKNIRISIFPMGRLLMMLSERKFVWLSVLRLIIMVTTLACQHMDGVPVTPLTAKAIESNLTCINIATPIVSGKRYSKF
jgi:hypothetical protein